MLIVSNKLDLLSHPNSLKHDRSSARKVIISRGDGVHFSSIALRPGSRLISFTRLNGGHVLAIATIIVDDVSRKRGSSRRRVVTNQISII